MEKNSTSNVDAHENNIAFISLNYDGSIMATASDKGTLIRLFLTNTCSFVQEFRRGKDKACIRDICFSNNNKLIACSSNKGTVHIWNMENKLKEIQKETNEEYVQDNNKKENENEKEETNVPENHKSFLAGLPNFFSGGFFKSEWSFANVRIKDTNSICCFGEDNSSIIIISSQGNYYIANIDLKKGGDCVIKQKIEFAK
jgi:WD40 repeat protein